MVAGIIALLLAQRGLAGFPNCPLNPCSGRNIGAKFFQSCVPRRVKPKHVPGPEADEHYYLTARADGQTGTLHIQSGPMRSRFSQVPLGSAVYKKIPADIAAKFDLVLDSICSRDPFR